LKNYYNFNSPQPDQIIRTINALQEPQHHFVVHVDAKSHDTFNQLSKYAEKWVTEKNDINPLSFFFPLFFSAFLIQYLPILLTFTFDFSLVSILKRIMFTWLVMSIECQ
jgi:hypothetical protein